MATQQTYLETRGLSVGYRNKNKTHQLLSNLNLSVAGGTMICFMGPNGSGKSSLLRTLAGLQPPLSGDIVIHGSGSRRREQQVSVVLTDRIQGANLTVEEIITFGRYPYLGWNLRLTDEDRAMLANAVSQVRVGPLLKRKLYELSDGQLQMVMIARALAQDTPVMLLDEPTAHLDLNNRVEVMNLLRELSRSTGKAILLATHELDLALQTADMIWLTGKDQTILEGLPEDLVLNGSFDDIFRFKGFDLKSGKVLHHPHRNVSICLTGEGPAYLWTKNALERNGFHVSDEERDISVSILQESAELKWRLTTTHTTVDVTSIERLINSL